MSKDVDLQRVADNTSRIAEVLGHIEGSIHQLERAYAYPKPGEFIVTTEETEIIPLPDNEALRKIAATLHHIREAIAPTGGFEYTRCFDFAQVITLAEHGYILDRVLVSAPGDAWDDKANAYIMRRPRQNDDPLSPPIPEHCPVCKGEKEIDCQECGGVGREDCPDCLGKGKSICYPCDGYGSYLAWVTHQVGDS